MGVSEMVRLVSPRNNCRQAGRQRAAGRPAVMLGARAGLRGQPEAGRSGVCVQGLWDAGKFVNEQHGGWPHSPG